MWREADDRRERSSDRLGGKRPQESRKRGTARSSAIGVAAALVGMTAAACTGAGSGGQGPTTPGTHATLSYADDPVGSVSDNFNPFSPNNALSLLDAQFIYDPLLQWDLLKSNTYYPLLPTSYQFAT